MNEIPEYLDLEPPEGPRLALAVLAAWKGCCTGKVQGFPQRAKEGPSDNGDLTRATVKPTMASTDTEIVSERLTSAN